MLPRMPTRKSNEVTMMHVHPAFRRKIKFDALAQGKSVLEYTREVGIKSQEAYDEMAGKMREQREKSGFKLNF